MNNQTVTELGAFQVRFEGFEDLPAVKGRDRTDSPQFTCFGHQWFVRLYPGGHASSGDGKVAAYLHNCSPVSIEVQHTFTAANTTTGWAAIMALGAKKYQAMGGEQDNWGVDFAKRSTIIGALQDGALVIEVQMKRTESKPPVPFVPENPFGQNILSKLFMDEESADVVFEVSRDPAKNAPTTFPVHHFVLPESGALVEACGSSQDLTPIAISGIEPEIFRHLLFYLYGGKIDVEVMKEHAKEIIDAADRFGVVELKLAAEAAFLSSTTISIDNVMDNLLFADAKNLALLQEAVMDFCVEKGEEAAKLLSFEDIPGSFAADLLLALSRRKKGDDASNLRVARVSALRKLLHEKGLDVDGSRETLIARLEEISSD